MLLADDLARLKEQLIVHEGIRLHPYNDSRGYMTIGVGRNLSVDGITQEEAMLMLDHDINISVRDLTNEFPWTTALDAVRFRVLVDMVFNLGLEKFATFTTFVNLVQVGNYAGAADDMLHTAWAAQVKGRAQRLATMMRLGVA